MEKIMALKKNVNEAGLELEVIESVNVHEDIKLGVPSRDRYIENYKQCIRNLAKAVLKVICYNFMPFLLPLSQRQAWGIPFLTLPPMPRITFTEQILPALQP